MNQSSIFLKSFKIFLFKTLIVVGIFSAALYAGVKVYAVYYPADNITDPTCAPGYPGCYVSLFPDQTSNAGKFLITNGTNPSWSTTITNDVTINTLTIGLGGGNFSTNSAVGVDALFSNTTGGANTAIGFRSLRENITGNMNSALGYNSLRNSTTGSENSAFGYNSMFANTTGGKNSAFGKEALGNNTTGSYNTAIGYQALVANTTGAYNVAIGDNALDANTIGGSNIGLGHNALGLNVSGDSNIAAGWNTLASNTTGSYNIGFGSDTLASNTTGVQNIALGQQALVLNSTGQYNVATGTQSLFNNTTGGNNIAYGYYAGYDSQTGSNNIFLGAQTGLGITTGSNNTILGANVSGLSSSLSNNIIIADGAGNRRINVDSSGNVGIGTTTPNSKLSINVPTTNTTFSGTGANDATFSGTYAGPGNYVTVTIASVGATDTFSYSSCCGGGSNVTITPGVSQSLIWGMSVTFGAGTGHQVGDSWTYSTVATVLNPGPVLNISDASGNAFFKVNAVAVNSNFIGDGAGYSAINSSSSNFFGSYAGYQATNSGDSNFLGFNSGNSATNTNNSNFFGSYAGYQATNSRFSNFFGSVAGRDATNAEYSNFFGQSAGYGATNASHSNFFGSFAGTSSTNAQNSNFFGQQAGFQATSASYSNLFGYQVGLAFSANNIGSNNIIIGTNISLGNAVANSMNIGGVLFGTGFYSTTTGNPSITPISGGKIGIANASPSYTLHVGSASIVGIVSRFQNSTGTCDINPTTTALSCSSDRNLKTNISNINNNILNNLTSLQPVTYNWISDTTGPTQTGFIAQDVESIFPNLVSTDPNTNLKSLNYIGLIPYTIEGIKELNLKIDGIASLDVSNGNSVGSLIASFLRDQITFAKEMTIGVLRINDQVCVDDVCVTKEQFKSLLLQAGGTSNINPPSAVVPDEVLPVSDTVPPADSSVLEVVPPAEVPVVPSPEPTPEIVTPVTE